MQGVAVFKLRLYSNCKMATIAAMPELEILDALPSRSPNYGGKRAGAGRKKKEVEEAADFADYGKARARHESAKATLAELDLKVKSGLYVSRDGVRQACATAMAAAAQTLRSIPDNLERKLGVSPTVAEEVGRQVDAVLNDLADEFEMMTGPDE